MQLYSNESSDPKTNAQRNLSGRTHYVDDATLRFHKSRILQTAIAYNGLIFALIESYAVDYQNTKRRYRPVLFDIFGTVISRASLEDGLRSKDAAVKAMWLSINALDAHAHTLQAIDRHERHVIAECEQMRAKVREMEGAK